MKLLIKIMKYLSLRKMNYYPLNVEASESIWIQTILLYIETSKNESHKLLIHTTTEENSIYGTLKELAASLSRNPNFYRCSKSIIINILHVSNINKDTKTFHLSNGDYVPYTSQYLKNILNGGLHFEI